VIQMLHIWSKKLGEDKGIKEKLRLSLDGVNASLGWWYSSSKFEFALCSNQFSHSGASYSVGKHLPLESVS